MFSRYFGGYNSLHIGIRGWLQLLSRTSSSSWEHNKVSDFVLLTVMPNDCLNAQSLL